MQLILGKMMNWVTNGLGSGLGLAQLKRKIKKGNAAAEIQTHDRGEAHADEGSTYGGLSAGREPVRGSGCRIVRKMKEKIGARLGFENTTLRWTRGVIW